MNIHSIYCLLILLLLTGCGEAPPRKQADSQVEIVEERKKTPEPTAVDLSAYGQLVPLEIVDSTAGNSYEKYGIEFSGNCYACDLARMEVSQQQLTFINVCDDNDLYKIANITCTTSEEGIRIQAGAQVFVLTKIDAAPVYELKITGKNLILDNKRISTYYTQAKQLHKFKEHDCGDFQG